MELFFTDRRRAQAARVIPGIDPADVTALFARRVALDGMPVLRDKAMRPVEPLTTWFRHLALMGRSHKTMRKYAYIASRLASFLAHGGTDVVSATETEAWHGRPPVAARPAARPGIAARRTASSTDSRGAAASSMRSPAVRSTSSSTCSPTRLPPCDGLWRDG
jgi:hypothetical protein